MTTSLSYRSYAAVSIRIAGLLAFFGASFFASSTEAQSSRDIAEQPEITAKRSLSATRLISLHRPADLSRNTWDFVDSAAEDVNKLPPADPSSGTIRPKFSLPVERPTQSGVGWFLFDFEMPPLDADPGVAKQQREQWTTVLSIGSQRGDLTVFLNGEQIGEYNDPQLKSGYVPRRIVFPTDLLGWGMPNEIALRFDSTSLTVKNQNIGIPEGPITLAALDRYELQERLETSRARLGDFYRTLYRAANAGLMGSPGFALLAKTLNEIQATVGEAQRAWDERSKTLGEDLQELDDFLEEAESSRARLETKALIEMQQAEQRLAESFAKELGVPVDQVHARPDGYGRFGHLTSDGLTGLRYVDPLSFAALPGRDVRIHLAGVEAVDVMEASWVTKSYRVVGKRDRTPIPGSNSASSEPTASIYHMHASNLFPGVLLDFKVGREVTFELPYEGKDIGIYQFAVLEPSYGDILFTRYMGSGQPQETLEEKRRKRSELASVAGFPRITLIVPFVEKSSPILIVHSQETAIRARRANARDERTLIDIAAPAAPIGRMTFLFPLGIRSADARPQEDEDRRLIPNRIFGQQMGRLLAGFYRFGARFPLEVNEVYHINRDAGRLEVLNRFNYITLNERLAADGFSPAALPPILHTAQKSGYPVKWDDGFRLRFQLPSPEGGFYMAESQNGRLRWSLPLPTANERLHPAPLAQSAGSVVASMLLDPDLDPSRLGESGDLIANLIGPVRAGYRAWPQLTEDQRRRLSENASTAFDSLASNEAWIKEREPFTGIVTEWLNATAGPRDQIYDGEIDNALAIDALWLHAALSGGAENIEAIADLVKKRLWPRISATEDWGWMRASNAGHGAGTGPGHATNAVFMGSLAYARLMDLAGRTKEADEGWYLAARSAVPVLARPLAADYARRNRLMNPKAVPLGWLEGEGFLTASPSNYPWPAVSLIDANGVAPPLFDLMANSGVTYRPLEGSPAPLLEALLNQFNTRFPRWWEVGRGDRGGKGAAGGKTAFNGITGRITLPLIYGQARLGQPTTILEEYLQRAAINTNAWNLSGPVIAQIATHDSGVWLQSWTPFNIRRFALEEEGARVVLDTIALKDSYSRGQLSIRLPREPVNVYLNGGTPPSGSWDAASNVWSHPITISQPGLFRFVWDLADMPSPFVAPAPAPAPVAVPIPAINADDTVTPENVIVESADELTTTTVIQEGTPPVEREPINWPTLPAANPAAVAPESKAEPPVVPPVAHPTPAPDPIEELVEETLIIEAESAPEDDDENAEADTEEALDLSGLVEFAP